MSAYKEIKGGDGFGEGAGFWDISKKTGAKTFKGIAALVDGVKAADGGFAKLGATAKGVWGIISSHPILSTVAAVATLVAIFDAVTVSAAEATEAMDTALSERDSAANKVETVNKELETANNRIDELNAKGGLTLVEAAELKKLRESIVLMKQQLDIAKEAKRVADSEAADKTLEAYNKNFKVDISKEQTAFYKKNYDNAPLFDSLDGFGEVVDKNDISVYLARIESLKELQAAEQDASEKVAIGKKIEEEENAIWKSIASLEEYRDTFESFDYLTDDQRIALSEIKNSIEYVYGELRPEKLDQWKIDNLFNKESFAEARRELVKTAKESDNVGISVEQLANEYPNLATAIKMAGIDIEKVVSGINSEAGIINVEEVRQQIWKETNAGNGGWARAHTDVQDWINKLELEDLKLAYQISLDADTAQWTLKEWQNALDYARANYSTLDFSISVETENVGTIQTARSEAFSPTGLSSESISAIKSLFEDLEGYNYATLFEQTAFGVQLNTEAFGELNKEYKKVKKQKLEDNLKDLESQWAATKSALDLYKEGTEEYNRLSSNLSGIEKQIQEIQGLMSMYSGLTSAYSEWLAAKESSNQNDIYEAMASGYKEAKELYKEGLVGTDDFTSYVEMIKGAEALAAAEKEFGNYGASKLFEDFDQKIKGTSHSLEDFLQGGKEGTLDFLDTLKQLGLATKDGDTWSFENLNIEDAANKFGVSVEFMISMLQNLRAYGFEVDIDPTFDTIDELNEKIKESAENIEEEFGSIDIKPVDIDINATGAEASIELNNIRKYVEELNANPDIDINVKTALLNDAYLKAKLLFNQTNAPYIMNLDVSNVEAGQQAAVAAIKSYQDAVASASAAKLTFGADSEQALAAMETLNAKKEELANTPEVSTILSIDDLASASIEEISASIWGLKEDTSPIKLNAELESQDIESIINGIVGEHAVTLNVSVPNLKQVQDLKTAIDGIKSPPPVNVNVKVNGDEKLSTAKSDLDSVDSKDVSVTIDVPGKDDLQVASESSAKLKSKLVLIAITTLGKDAIDKIKNAFDVIQSKAVELSVSVPSAAVALVDTLKAAISGVESKNVEVKAETSGEADVNRLKAKIGSINDKNVTVTFDAVQTQIFRSMYDKYNYLKDKTVHITYTASGDVGADGTAHGGYGGTFSNGTAYAEGTAFKRGDWGTKNSGVALMGEVGPELRVYNGKWTLAGGDSAEFVPYRRGEIIFNAEQTEQIFKYGKIKHGRRRGKSFATGTATSGPAFAGGNASGSGSIVGGGGSSGGGSSSGSGSGSSGSADDFKESLDWIEIAIDRIERIIEHFDKKASSTYKTWIERNKNLTEEMKKITEEIELQEDAYERYIQEANSVSLGEDWKQLVRDGAIDIDTITDKNLAENIKSYQEWYEKALDCKDAIDDLGESLSECYEIAFENIATQYEAVISAIETEKKLIDEYISQSEERGIMTSVEYYKRLISFESENVLQLEKEKQELINAMNAAVESGAIAEGSESWADMKEEIDDVTISIAESNTELIKYANSIREIQWDSFDYLRERVENFNSEIDFLIDLLERKKLHDDKGILTSDGLAYMGLLGANYNTYMSEADKYAEEIIRLDEEIAKNPYNKDLLDRRQELLESQRDMIAAAEDEKESIKSLVGDGINLELTALQELISKYGEALDASKDLYDYQKDISEKTSNISVLRKQLLAYEGDNSPETSATVQKLKDELKKAETELSETENDRNISEQKKLLDELYQEYQEILNERLDNVDSLISDSINSANSNADSIGKTIEETAESVGYSISKGLKEVFDSSSMSDVNNALSVYTKEFTNQLTSVNKVLNSISSNVSSLIYAGNVDADAKLGIGKQYKTGGIIDYTGIAKVDGTQSKPELVLNAADTKNFLDLRDHLRSLAANSELSIGNYNSDVFGYVPHVGISNIGSFSDKLSLTPVEIEKSMTYGDINITIDHVENYEDFIRKFRKDPKAERIVQDMTLGQAIGKASTSKFRHNLQ